MKSIKIALLITVSFFFASCASRLQINPYTGQARLVPASGGFQQQGPPQMAQSYQGGGRGYNSPLPQGHQMMPDGRVRYVKGYQQTQTGQKKTLRSHFEAKVDGDQSRRTDVARYAGEYYDRTGTLLTEQQLTAHFGFRCAARKVN